MSQRNGRSFQSNGELKMCFPLFIDAVNIAKSAVILMQLGKERIFFIKGRKVDRILLENNVTLLTSSLIRPSNSIRATIY